MKSFTILFALMVLVASSRITHGADKPSDLIIGKWRDRAEPDDAVIEFSKDGTGTITETTPEQTNQVKISWKIRRSFGDACIIFIKYEVPKPNDIKPLTWLIAFDGKNTYVSQPIKNKIVYMDRLKRQK